MERMAVWPHLNFSDWYLFLLVKLIQYSEIDVNRLLRNISTVPILFTYTFHVNTADNLMNTKMWFYRQKRSKKFPNISAYLRSRMCEYKHYNKSSLEHMFFPVTSIQPTCSLMHTHAQENHRDEGRGLLTSWPRPAGAFWSVARAKWALGVDCLCNSPDLQRNKSPLYFTHMFNCTK